MPFDRYNKSLKLFGLQEVPEIRQPKEVIRAVKRDIPVLGKKGLTTVEHIGTELVGVFGDCNACGTCAKECPEGAITIKKNGPNMVIVVSELCSGTACKRCERICPQKTFNFQDLMIW
jgi:NAD-dependent dihydropyrimidine dehydrogenase PreA subunit